MQIAAGALLLNPAFAHAERVRLYQHQMTESTAASSGASTSTSTTSGNTTMPTAAQKTAF